MAALLEAAGVDVTGWQERDKALDRLADLDVYVQTSLWEGMPIAVIEAQVAGIPAVVTDVVGNRDVVEDGVTGFVVANPREMYERVAQLSKDPDLRYKMGAEARRRARIRFSLDRMVGDLIGAYGFSD